MLDKYTHSNLVYYKHNGDDETLYSSTYSECVYAALGVHHVTPMHHIVICGLSGFAGFFHIISYAKRFFKKKKLPNICVLFSPQLLFGTFLITKELSEI